MTYREEKKTAIKTHLYREANKLEGSVSALLLLNLFVPVTHLLNLAG